MIKTILCVLGMIFLIIIVMLIISNIYDFIKSKIKERKAKNSNIIKRINVDLRAFNMKGTDWYDKKYSKADIYYHFDLLKKDIIDILKGIEYNEE